MARNISTLLPLLHIPRCPESLVLQALRNSFRRFCENTGRWYEKQDPILTVTGQKEYDIELTPELQTASLIVADGVNWTFTVVGHPFRVTDSIVIVSASGDYDGTYTIDSVPDANTFTIANTTVNADSDGQVRFTKSEVMILNSVSVKMGEMTLLHDGYEIDVTTNKLTLARAPQKDGIEIVMTLAFIPITTVTEAPDWLFDRFGEVIANGAAAELKKTPGSQADPVPWYDPNGAALAERDYLRGQGQAKREVVLKSQSENRHLNVPYF